jgi:hypothetical protein
MVEELQPALLGGWDPALLAPIAEVNQYLLEALRAAAMASDRPRVPRLLTLLREEWTRLDRVALERLAACPYLLLDAGFSQPGRWERLAGGVMDAPAAASGYLEGPEAVALLRRALMLGWHLARSNRIGARLVCGMSMAVAERLGSSRLQDLELLAERSAAALAPRWEQQPRVWQQLLRAACLGQSRQLRTAQLRGLQLLAAACVPYAAEAGWC